MQIGALFGAMCLGSGWAGRAVCAEPLAPKRALPDYDGRGPAGRDAADAVTLVPRLLLSPLFVTDEYLLRRPLAVAIPAAERHDVPRRLYDFFTFGPGHQGGFLPVGFAEFDLQPSYGVYVFWHDAFLPGHDLYLHAETWTADWLSVALTQRLRFGRHLVELQVRGIRRPDYPFYGLGPDAPYAHRSRYGARTLESKASYDVRLWRASHVTAGVGVRAVQFSQGWHDDDRSLEDAVAAGTFAAPPGMDRGYAAELQHVTAVLDTRRPWPETGSGVRLKAHVEEANDLQAAPSGRWLRTEATAAGYWDVTGARRVLSLSVAAQFIDPLGAGTVPFTELIMLGGNGLMRGFPWQRLMERSAAAATLRYEWPVGPWITGTIQGAFGNVFEAHLRSFDRRLLRMSWAVGLSSEKASSSEYPIELLFGLGTRTLEDGAGIESVRVAVGVNYGI